jgi:hypothetical protein
VYGQQAAGWLPLQRHQLQARWGRWVLPLVVLRQARLPHCWPLLQLLSLPM